MAAPPAPSQLVASDCADTAVAGARSEAASGGKKVLPASRHAQEGRAERAEQRHAEHCRFVAQLFESYRRPLLRYVTGLLGRRGDAEDVLQEAYARLLAVPALDRTPARARAYLFKTATNLVHDRFRRHEPSCGGAAHEYTFEDPAETPERIVDFEQGLAAVWRALLELKPRCRAVFVLRAAEGLDYDEIAARLHISRRTVEREMQHALDVCQQRLKRAWK